MEWVILLVLIGSVYGAYKFGEKEGIESVNKAQIDAGTWIEVKKPVKYQPTENNEQDKIPVGTIAIVTGKDKWNRINI